MYYGNCLLTVRSGTSLRNFIANRQPAHAQTIRGLRILRRPQSTCADFRIVVGDDLGDYGKTIYPKLIQQPSDVSILGSFQGLEELYLKLDVYGDESNILPLAHRFSTGVVKAILDIAKDMRSLKTIVCQTIVCDPMSLP